ncbi:MAG: ribosome silencing factor [Chitinivibrionales bacterium]|nr:ribosome silencing factor [Chitinivibrionales bacterium]
MIEEKKEEQLSGKRLVEEIVGCMIDRKAEDIAVYDVTGMSTVCDWYVICSGTAPVHATAIAHSIVRELKQQHTRPVYTEGLDAGRWAVVDYADVVVHVMVPAIRDYYQIEELWSEGERLTTEQLPQLRHAETS